MAIKHAPKHKKILAKVQNISYISRIKYCILLNVYIVCMARFRYKCVNTLNYLASRRNRSNADTAATVKINWNINHTSYNSLFSNK